MAYNDSTLAPYWQSLTASFGGGTLSYRLQGPPGMKGLVTDILVDVTTTMVGTTTVPEIQIGSAAGSTGTAHREYGCFKLGSAAGTGYDTTTGAALRARKLATQRDNTVAGYSKPVLNDFTGHILLETDFITKDAAFFISLVAGTGGSPAGAASVYVFIKWI